MINLRKDSRILFRRDSRDSHAYMHFGSVGRFPDSASYDSPLVDEIQPIGDVRCTCFTTVNVAEDQDGAYYDIDDLAKRITFTEQGADPRQPLSEAVKNGLLIKGQTERVKRWSSYWRADTGPYDSFDNVRSIMSKMATPVAVGTYWYTEYGNSIQTVDINGQLAYVLPLGVNATSGHMYEVEGWMQVNGEPMLIIEAWLGKKLLMSREVFNSAMKPAGMTSWVLSTSDRDIKRDKTIMEAIIDACTNVIIALKALLVLKQKPIDNPIVNPVKDDYQVVKDALKLKGQMITKWANAIAKWEGDVTGVNPGNLKFAPLTQSWGAKKGRKAQDGGYFCLFDSYDLGFNALCKFLELGCKDELKSFHNARTIEKFMIVYAGNPPKNYLNGVIKDTGVDKDTDISTFLL